MRNTIWIRNFFFASNRDINQQRNPHRLALVIKRISYLIMFPQRHFKEKMNMYNINLLLHLQIEREPFLILL
ncbi:hypothetical protein CW304_30935 [Bacillus sp. UFRGS-B20]|nr:hypothetical protein CW304_30935 [Bacillus sp. UFRGS-B20]